MAGAADIGIAQRSVRGSLLLFIGNFLQAVISAVGVIIVARLLGPPNYGVFTLSLAIPSLILLFLGFGVNTAVTRYAAYYLSIGRPEEAKRFSRSAVFFLALFGLVLTGLNYVAAGFLSSILLHRPEITGYVQAASVFILGQAVFQAAYAGLIGWNSMKLASVSQVVQATLKIGLSIGLVVAGFGVLGAVLGHAISWLIAGGFAWSLLYIMRLRGPQGDLGAFASDIKEMTRYGFPLYAGALISGLASSYLVIILAGIASNTLVGDYQAAVNITIPISLVSTSIASALLPAFAHLDGTGGDIGAALRHSVKYVAYLVTPIVVFLISAASALFALLYQPSYHPGVIFLQLLAVANLPIVAGPTVISTVFSGIGRTRLAMVQATSGAVVLLILAPLLGGVLGLGVPGLIYASLLSTGAAVAGGLVLADKYMRISIDYRSSAGVLAASFLALALTLPISSLRTHESLILLIQLFIFAAVYLTAAPLLRAISLEDIARLEVATEGLGVVGKLTKPLLEYEKYLVYSSK